MYILKYAEQDEQFKEVEERFRSLSLGFKKEYFASCKEVSLFDNEEMVAQGREAIQKHLDELSEELHQWYYCSC